MKKTFSILGLILASFFTKAQTWENMGNAPAGAFQIEADFNGDAYILGPTTASNIYRKKSTETTFTLLAGGGILNDISVSGGKMYGSGGFNVQKNSNIYFNSGAGWGLFITPAGKLTDLEFNGITLFGRNENNALYETTINGTWQALSEPADKVAKAKDGTTIIRNGKTSKILRGGQYVTISTTLELISITAASLENVWAVDTLGDVYQYNNTNTSWEKKTGSNFKSISMEGNNELWALGNDGNVYKSLFPGATDKYTSWIDLGNAPASATQIEVSNNGDLYVIGANVANKGNVYLKKTTDAAFAFLPGVGIASDIAAHSNRLIATGLANTFLYEYNYTTNAWMTLSPASPTGLPKIDINATTLVGGDASGNVRKHTFGGSWTALAGQYFDISIGTDNTIVATNGITSSIYNTTSSTWTTLSNNLALAVSVGGYNNIWGINADGNIYHFDHSKNTWKKKLQVPSGAKSISLYENEAIYAIGNDGKIYKADLTNIITNIEVESANFSSSILAYPNPAKDILNVSGTAEIFDLAGNKVASGTNEIHIGHLLSGIYLVKVNGRIQKIVKE